MLSKKQVLAGAWICPCLGSPPTGPELALGSVAVTGLLLANNCGACRLRDGEGQEGSVHYCGPELREAGLSHLLYPSPVQGLALTVWGMEGQDAMQGLSRSCSLPMLGFLTTTVISVFWA